MFNMKTALHKTSTKFHIQINLILLKHRVFKAIILMQSNLFDLNHPRIQIKRSSINKSNRVKMKKKNFF